MTENITPLTTEHLRIMRDDIAQFRADITKEVKDGFVDMRKRLTHIEHSVIGLKRDEVDAATEITEHRHTLDKLHDIVERLRQRLDELEARTAH